MTQPFICAKIMKVTAGSRGKTNNCMDDDYSNASLGIHGCRHGVTRFLNEAQELRFFFCPSSDNESTPSIACRILFILKHPIYSRFFMVLAFFIDRKWLYKILLGELF